MFENFLPAVCLQTQNNVTTSYNNLFLFLILRGFKMLPLLCPFKKKSIPVSYI